MWAPAAGGLAGVSTACVAGVYALAGMPGILEMILHIAALDINTHVLMILSAFGLLGLGKPLEVCLFPLTWFH